MPCIVHSMMSRKTLRFVFLMRGLGVIPSTDHERWGTKLLKVSTFEAVLRDDSQHLLALLNSLIK